MNKKIEYMLLTLILFLIGSCSNKPKELNLSRPQNVAKVFAEAFVNNDSTLFHRILLDKKEFEYWPITKDFSDSYEEYVNELNQTFIDGRYAALQIYSSSLSDNS